MNNIIDREFEVLDQEFYDYLSQRLGDIVRECGDKVPVLTGKIGKQKKKKRGWGMDEKGDFSI